MTLKAINDYSDYNMKAGELGDGKLAREDFIMIYGNARSMKSCGDKRVMLSEAAHKMDADILLASEAGYVEGAVEHIDGYSIAANQPKMTNTQWWTGGVAAWIRKGTKFGLRFCDYKADISGLQAVTMTLRNDLKINVFYRSPNQTAGEIEATIEYFNDIDEETIVVGDLNIPEACWDTNRIIKQTSNRQLKEELIRAVAKEGRKKQCVEFPTNKNNDNILDIVAAPSQLDVECQEVASPDGDPDDPQIKGTDHKWFSVRIKGVMLYDGIEKTAPFRKTDFGGVDEKLRIHKWRNIEYQKTHDEKECPTCELFEVTRGYIKQHTVEITPRTKPIVHNQLIDEYAERKMELKNRKKYDKSRELYDEWKITQRIHRKLCRIKRDKESKIFLKNLKKDKNAIYDPLGKQSKGRIECLYNDEGTLITESKDVAEILAEHMSKVFTQNSHDNPEVRMTGEEDRNKLSKFTVNEEQVKEAIRSMKTSGSIDPNGLSKKMIKNLPSLRKPIMNVVKKMIDNKHIPACLKTVHIVPIPKAGKNSAYAKNVRGINLAPIVLKILEKVVKEQMYEFLDKENFFSKAQHGYRKDRGTITCLLHLINQIRKSITEGAGSLILAMDLKAAFDCVPHDRLLIEIEKAGIVGDALELIREWLKENTFRCRIGETLSDPRPITSGVRQGSVLGPLLWIIYINQLLKDLPKDCVFAYADDVHYLHLLGKGNDPRLWDLEEAARISEEWSRRQGVEFSANKCKMICLGQRDPPETNIQLAGTKIEFDEENKITILGLCFQGGVKNMFTSAEDKAIGRVKLAFRQIRTFFKEANFREVQIVNCVYSRSRAAYAAACWNTGWYEKVGDEYVMRDKQRAMKIVDRCHALTLKGKRAAEGDIRTKGFNGAVHLLPSQNTILVQTVISLEILAGNMEVAGLVKEDFLPVNAFATNATTRARDLGRFEQSMSLQSLHGQYSLLFKQNKSISELLKTHPDLLHITPIKRKALVFDFYANMNCHENNWRKLIGEGTWRPKSWKPTS